MALASGTRLGPYEILSALGTGGMGEVYRARDTRLQRAVAIKVLPDVFAADPERLARFQREAQVLASLNHPYIAHIHGLEESAGVRALVMELVEGETLADRITRGAIPLDEALPIARQICEALEAAHEQGVIHRDLKPANIKITPDGMVKVLDFGLAKLTVPAHAPASDLSLSPTITSPAMMTGVGVLLGTVAYMSPEQAKGRPANKRSDVWAFGCVLYEMLTGVRAFRGNDVTDTLAFVITKEPDWATLPVGVPNSIRQLLRQCLQKDRRERLRDVGDARLQIQEAQLTHEPELNIASIPGATNRTRERVVWASAVVLAAAVALTPVLYFRQSAPPSEVRLDVITPPTSYPAHIAISPDGRRLAFVASGDGDQHLWLRSLDSTTAQPLPGTDGAQYPFWSPDSRSIGFFALGKLKRLDIGAGLPRTLTDAPSSRGGTWSAEGTILFTPRGDSPLFRVPASGGEAVPATTLINHVAHRFPSFLPSGRKFLFYAAGQADTAGIYIGSLDSSDAKRLIGADTAGVFAPPDWLFFVRQGTLVAQHIDIAAGVVSGDLVTVADPILLDGASNVGAVSVSATGVVILRSGTSRRQLVWFDRSGRKLGTLGPPDDNNLSAPSLSPDGQRVAVHRTIQGNTDIWIIDATRSTRFTFDQSPDLFPLWSPDGNKIVFDSSRNGPRDLYQGPANAPGSETLLFASPLGKAANDWSLDGRYLLFTIVNDPKTIWDLSVLPLDAERKPFDFLKTAAQEGIGQFSPNGRWVAYQSIESGSLEVYVRPFPGPGPQLTISTGGGGQARWSPDGKELYYIALDGTLMAVPLNNLNEDVLAAGIPTALFHPPISGGGTIIVREQYDVAPDGRFLINIEEASTAPITVVLNWNPRKGQ